MGEIRRKIEEEKATTRIAKEKLGLATKEVKKHEKALDDARKEETKFKGEIDESQERLNELSSEEGILLTYIARLLEIAKENEKMTNENGEGTVRETSQERWDALSGEECKYLAYIEERRDELSGEECKYSTYIARLREIAKKKENMSNENGGGTVRETASTVGNGDRVEYPMKGLCGHIEQIQLPPATRHPKIVVEVQKFVGDDFATVFLRKNLYESMNMTGKATKQVYGENLSALFRMVNYTVPGIREGKIRVGKNEEKYHIITEEAMVVLNTLEDLILKKDLNMNMSLERTMTRLLTWVI